MNSAPDIDAMRRAADTGEPRAQFQLAVMHFTRGNYRDALPWLDKAVAQHWAEAENLLALMALNGFGLGQDTRRACELFRAAARQDLKEAHYNLGGLLFNGLGVTADEPGARFHIRRAAELGHTPAFRSLGFAYSQASPEREWQALATQCFARAALQGDPLAQHALGARFLAGSGIERDRDEGIYWLAGAARRGMYSSRVRLAELCQTVGQAHVSKVAERAAPAKRVLSEHAPALPDWNFAAWPEPQADAETGPLARFPDVLDAALCEHLINVAAPRLADSQVIDPETGERIRNAFRTSRSMTFGPSMYDIVIGTVLRRLAKIAGVPASHAEPLTVLQYRPGQEYKPHFDYFVPAPNARKIEEPPGGARIVTVFVYLNDVEAGGATDFPRLGARVQPQRGRAVKFLNYSAAGEPDKLTLHAGLPVERGEKWLATFWFRERPLND
jgi:TPR repeat protein